MECREANHEEKDNAQEAYDQNTLSLHGKTPCLLSEFWDLKILAFQAKTSCTLDLLVVKLGETSGLAMETLELVTHQIQVSCAKQAIK